MSNSEDDGAIYGDEEENEFVGKMRRLVLSMLGLRYLWEVLSKQFDIYISGVQRGGQSLSIGFVVLGMFTITQGRFRKGRGSQGALTFRIF